MLLSDHKIKENLQFQISIWLVLLNDAAVALVMFECDLDPRCRSIVYHYLSITGVRTTFSMKRL